MGAVEAYVELVDASVDAQELSYNDIEDLGDYLEELDEEDLEALYAELDTAIDAYETFMESVTENDDLLNAINQIVVLAMTGDD